MAVSSPVDICNMALDLVGKPSIADFNESGEPGAILRRHYDPARRTCLAFSDWSFARGAQLLASLPTNDFEDVWGYAYDMPDDAVTPRRVCERGQMPNVNQSPPPMYVQSGTLYTNVQDARLFFTRDDTDVLKWTPQFDDAVAALLASRIVFQLTRRRQDEQALYDAYTTRVAKAGEHDAAQEVTTYRYGDGYVDARYGGDEYESRSTDRSTYWR